MDRQSMVFAAPLIRPLRLHPKMSGTASGIDWYYHYDETRFILMARASLR
jgi:hypothetical protein